MDDKCSGIRFLSPCVFLIFAAVAHADEPKTEVTHTHNKPFTLSLGQKRRFGGGLIGNNYSSFIYQQPTSFSTVVSITYDRAWHGSLITDALFLDVLRDAPETKRISHDNYNAEEEDYARPEQFAVGFGIQRRFYSGGAPTRVRPYLGVGAGFYYQRAQVRFFGKAGYEIYHTTLGGDRPYSNTYTKQKITPGAKVLAGLEDSSGLFVQTEFILGTTLSVNNGQGGHRRMSRLSGLLVRGGCRF